MILRRIFNRYWPLSIEAAAASSRVIGAAVTRATRPSFHLPGEFEAVVDCVNHDRALEWRRVSGEPAHHLATIEHVLENVRFRKDTIFSGRYMARFPTNRPLEKEASAGSEFMSQALLSTNLLSGLEFGHWVRDSLVTEMHGFDEGLPAVGLPRQPWPHEQVFRDITALNCSYPHRCDVERLTILDDRGHNDHWVKRFSAVRQRTRKSAMASLQPSAGTHILLRRGADARHREPSNIEAVAEALEKDGFRSINPTVMSVSEIAGALRDARMVVGTEGSNLNHLHFFAPDGVALACLQDPNRFYAYHKGLMEFYDGRFGFIVGRQDAEAPGAHKVDIDDLKRTIDLAG